MGWAQSHGPIVSSSTANFGTAGTGTITYALTDRFGQSFNGADSGLKATVSGNEIFLYTVGDLVVGREGAGGVPNPDGKVVFALYLEPGSLKLDVAQYEAISHPDTNNPNDAVNLGNLVHVTQTVIADTLAAPTTSAAISITFLDDGPMLAVSDRELPSLIVDESFLAADANNPDAGSQQAPSGSTTAHASFAGLFHADFGADGPQGGDATAAVSYLLGLTGAVTTVDGVSGVASGVKDTLTGHEVMLNLVGGVIEGTVLDGATVRTVFTITGSSDGTITLQQERAVSHNDPDDPDQAGSPVTLDLAGGAAITLTATATDGDGDHVSHTVDLSGAFQFKDDGPTLHAAIHDVIGSNLIVNGSFEEGHGDLGASDWSIYASLPGGTPIGTPGVWTYGADHIPFEVQTGGAGGLAPQDGSALIELDGDTQGNGHQGQGAPDQNGHTNATIQQVIAGTADGQDYQLTFWYAPRPGYAGSDDSGLNVLWNGNVVYTIDSSSQPAGWQLVTVNVVGTGPNNTLGFQGVGAEDELGALLDNVSLVAVTPPRIVIDETPATPQAGTNETTDAAIADLFHNVGNTGVDPDMTAQYATGGTGVLDVNVNFGADGPKDGSAKDATVYSLSLGSGGPNGLVDSGLTTTGGQHHIYLFSEDGVIVGRVDGAQGVAAFAIAIDPATGVVSVAQYLSLNNPVTTDSNDPVFLNTGVLSATVTVTDGDGDHASQSADIGALIEFRDDGPTIVGSETAPYHADEGDIVTLQSLGTSPNDGNGDGSFTGWPTADIGVGPAEVSGSVASPVNFGADGKGGFSFAADTISTLQDLGLTSKGGALSYTFLGDTLIAYVDGHPDRAVFTLSLNHTTGNFLFTLSDQLDHVVPAPGTADTNTALQGSNGPVNGLDFGSLIVATDGDGDTVTLDGHLTIEITDDIPKIISFDTTGKAVTIDETAGQQGNDTTSSTVAQQFVGVAHVGHDPDMGNAPQFAFNSSAIVKSLYVSGADDSAHAVLSLTIDHDGVDSNLTTTDGHHIYLFNENGIIVGRIDGDGGGAAKFGSTADVAAFAISIGQDGKISVAQYLSIHNDNPNDPNDVMTLGSTISAQLTVTDNDGDTVTRSVTIGDTVQFRDDGPTLTGNGVTAAVNEANIYTPLLSQGTHPDFPAHTDILGAAYATGSLSGAVNPGADGLGSFSFTANAASQLETLHLSSKGEALSYTIFNGVLVGYVDHGQPGLSLGDRVVFSLTLTTNGNYNFELFDQLDHDKPPSGADTNTTLQDNGANSAHDAIDFGQIIQVTDGDGDHVTLDGSFSVSIKDDIPTVSLSTHKDFHGHAATVVIDESAGQQDNDINHSLSVFSGVQHTGSDPDMGTQYAQSKLLAPLVDADVQFGADGPGSAKWSIELNPSNNDSGLRTTDHHEIRLFQEGGLIVGRYDISDGAVDSSDPAAFAIAIDPATGQISIVQYVSIENTTPGNPDETNFLNANEVYAKLTVTDYDGDSVSDTIDIGQQIGFSDDGPTLDIRVDRSALNGLDVTLDETVGADRYSSTDNVAGDTDVNGGPNSDDVAGAPAQRTTDFSGAGLLGLFNVVEHAGADGVGSESFQLSFTGLGSTTVASGADALGHWGDGIATNLSATAGGAIKLFLASATNAAGSHDIVGYDADGHLALRIGIVDVGGHLQLQTTLYEALNDGNDNNNQFDHSLTLALTGQGASIGLNYAGSLTDGDGDTATDNATVTLISSSRNPGYFVFQDDGPAILSVAQFAGGDAPNTFMFDGFTENGGVWGAGSGINATGKSGAWTIAGVGGGSGAIQLERVGDGYLGMHSSTHGFMVDLDASAHDVAVSQTLNLVQGETYKLSFDYGANPSGDTHLQVLFGGKVIFEVEDAEMPGQMTPKEIVLIGGSGDGSNLLEFRDVGTADNYGTFLANVQVTGSTVVVDDEDTHLNGVGLQGGPGDDGSGATAYGVVSFDAGSDGLKSIAISEGIKVTNSAGATASTLSAIYVDANGVGTPEALKEVWVADTDNGGGTLYGVSATGTHFTQDNPAFALHIAADGTYTFKLNAPLNHPFTTADNTVAPGTEYEDNLSLGFAVNVTDGDGDTATATITINVDDDSPTLGAIQQVTIDDYSVHHGTIDFHAGADGVGGGSLAGSTPPANLMSGGQAVHYWVSADGHTLIGYTGNVITDSTTPPAAGNQVFTLTLDASDQGYSYQQIQAFDNTHTTVAPVNSTSFDYPNQPSGEVDVTYSGVTIAKVTGSGDVNGSGTGFGVHANKFTTGDVLHFDFKQSDTGTATSSATFSFTQDGSVDYVVHYSDNSSASVAGQAVTSGGTLTFTAPTGATINYVEFTGNGSTPTGGFKIVLDGVDVGTTVYSPLDLGFNVTLTDGDGDAVTGTINVDVHQNTPPTVKVTPTDPINSDDGHNLVNEAGLPAGSSHDGSNVTHGTFTLTDADGASDIKTVTITGAGGTETLTVVLGGAGTTVDGQYGTLVIDANPAISGDTATYNYTYTLNTPYTDSPAVPGQNIDQNADSFVISVTDGSSASNSTLVIDIRDDVAKANGDVNSVTEGGTLTVAAANGVLHNDVFGADGKAVGGGVTGVATGSNTANPVSGNLGNLEGQYGTLHLNADGSYTYDAHPDKITGNAVDHFVYTITDGDGDTSTARLDISVNNVTLVADNTTETVDEAALDRVKDPASGNVPADLAAGTVDGSDPTSRSETTEGQLNMTGGSGVQYTAMTETTDHGVFHLGADGKWTYTLTSPYETSPHSDSPHNTVSGDSFSYTAHDANGNTVTGTIQINVVDDKPVANNDTDSVGSGTSTDGNVITGADTTSGVGGKDTLGADGAHVSSAYGKDGAGSAQTVGTNTVIDGEYGRLTISSDGHYSYARTSGSGGTDTFTYTLEDGDGDTDTATLTITLDDTGRLVVGSADGDDGAAPDGNHVVDVTTTTTGPINGGDGNDTLIGDPGSVTITKGQTANVVLVLDSSGSMDANISFGGSTITRMQALKNGTNALIDQLANSGAENIRITVIDFGDSAINRGTFNLIVNGQKNADGSDGISAAHAAVNAMSYSDGNSGGTNYEAAIQSAYSWITGNSGNNDLSGADINKVVFVSDGEPNDWVGSGSSGGTTRAMQELLGTYGGGSEGSADNVNDVANVLGTGYTIDAIGIAVGSAALGHLSDVEDGIANGGTGSALNANSAEQLAGALAVLGGSTALAAAGNDVIHGGAGNDVIFGDVVNTDALAVKAGLTVPPGSGWSVFQMLEGATPTSAALAPYLHNGVWDRASTIAYLSDPANFAELATESGRSGGDDNITGGTGDDVIFAQEGNDIINYTVGDGHDKVDGGTGNDTLVVNGSTADEHFFLETVAAYNTRIDPDYTGAASNVLVSNETGQIMVEASNIESVTFNGGGGNDTLTVSGDFSGTAILNSTIHFNGEAGNDTLDLTTRVDNRRVVADGGADTDTVKLGFAYDHATYAAIAGGVQITHDGITDEFTNFENFVFSDGTTMTLADVLNAPPTTNDVSATGPQNATSIAITLSGSDDVSVASFEITELPLHGSLYSDAALTHLIGAAGVVAAAGNSATVYFVPDANYYGAPTFQYAAVDNTGRHDTTPATATINVVNQAPFIVAPANLQYDPASGDTTAFNRIMFTDADTTGGVTVHLTRTGGNGTLSATSSGGVAVSGTATDMVLSGTIDAINAYLAGNKVTLDTHGNDTDTFTISINDGTTTVSQTGFAVDDVQFSKSNNPDTNNYAGVNVYETSLNSLKGNDTLYTSWSHLGSSATAYDGGNGSDTINLIFTAEQLQAILATGTTRDELQAYLLGPTGDTLNLGATSWHATATGFETANIELANLYATRDVATPSNDYFDINTTWKSVIASNEIVGADGDGANNFIVASAAGQTLNGGGGNDVMVALDGGDTLNGGAGLDLLLGGSGNDTLIGGEGVDRLAGGAGADHFRFNATSEAGDHIVDFTHGQDVIDLLNSAFGGGSGAIATDDLIQVTGAQNPTTINMGNAHFAYQQSTGQLYYDPNGGAADANRILLAVFDNHTAIAATDLHKVG
nr:DUF5801 repeats-in-toxin domain-containing protein [Nitrobacter sp. 62-13]